MRTLAIRYVLEDVPRLVASVAGIAFVVALVLMQAGIYSSFVRSTTLLVDESDAQIWVGARAMSYLEITLPIRYGWVTRVRSIDGVAHAEPLVVRSAVRQSASGVLDYVRVIGFEPAGSSLHLGIPTGTFAAMRLGDFATDAAQLPLLDASGIGASGNIRGVPARVAAPDPRHAADRLADVSVCTARQRRRVEPALAGRDHGRRTGRRLTGQLHTGSAAHAGRRGGRARVDRARAARRARVLA